MRTWQQNPYCSFLDPLISFRHTYIHTLLRLPSTGLFSHNVNYYIILVINKRKLIYSSLMKFKIHSELFKIYSKLFCMKHIIKKCLLKTINIFSVLNNYCHLAHSIPLDPENKMPFVPLTVYIGGSQNCYIPLCSCCELLNVQ